MAKFTALFAVLLITFLAVAQATTFKTIITIEEEEEESKQGEGQSSPQRCMQQIQQQQSQLQHCQRYLQQSMSSGSEQISMVTNHHQEQEQEQQNLRECCNGLQNIRNEQCRCEAVRQAVQQGQRSRGRQGEGEGEGEQMEEMMEKAKNLPDMCNLKPRQCRFRSMFY